MRLYHFKGGDELKFNAHIFALTTRRAGELFLVHLLMNSQSTEAFIWREMVPEQFGEPDRSKVQEALALNIEGVASTDSARGWSPVPPFDSRGSDT